MAQIVAQLALGEDDGRAHVGETRSRFTHYRLETDASAGLLCRLLGLVAQRDRHALMLRVDSRDGRMTIDLDLEGVEPRTAAIIAEKMAGCFGVHSLALDGISLDDMPPTTAPGLVRYTALDGQA